MRWVRITNPHPLIAFLLQICIIVDTNSTTPIRKDRGGSFVLKLLNGTRKSGCLHRW